MQATCDKVSRDVGIEMHLFCEMVLPTGSLTSFPVVLVRNRSDVGVGDQVFINASGSKYIVLEVKHLHQSECTTARIARRKGRRDVVEHASSISTFPHIRKDANRDR